MELRMQYASTADNVRIAYGVAGDGQMIVRVPSLPFSHTQREWESGSDFYRELARNWRIVQLDPRGVGLSDRSVADVSLEARMLDIDAVVEKLGLETFALHAIGWSGPLAVTYAVRHPGRVSHLILDDSQARTEDFMNMPQIRALDSLIPEWDTFLNYLVYMIYGYGRDQAAPFVEHMKACVSPEGAQLIFNSARGDDVTELLPRVTQPALVVQHKGLSGKSEDAARELAALIPDARLMLLEGHAADDTGRIIHGIADLLGTDHAHAKAARDALSTSGVRTILFTDMVGHTEMMSRLGDSRGREILREHESITRNLLQQHGGDEVKSMGDGFMASFGSVTRAVECAIDLQRAIAGRNESADEPLNVRVGLNCGEPIEDGGDLFGATVILASRIAMKAEAGEILVADTVRGLCSGKGFLFSDQGEFVAKGFEDPIRVYEVNWRQ
ncbi:MAG TPA: adenylate/guanylate cyclase domain-containing protein [Dehalococcoidia bacterium]|nr:adenylate/guanylate cyclase domain-containing protein [Dehalococcoidia bacterium]